MDPCRSSFPQTGGRASPLPSRKRARSTPSRPICTASRPRFTRVCLPPALVLGQKVFSARHGIKPGSVSCTCSRWTGGALAGQAVVVMTDRNPVALRHGLRAGEPDSGIAAPFRIFSREQRVPRVSIPRFCATRCPPRPHGEERVAKQCSRPAFQQKTWLRHAYRHTSGLSPCRGKQTSPCLTARLAQNAFQACAACCHPAPHGRRFLRPARTPCRFGLGVPGLSWTIRRGKVLLANALAPASSNRRSPAFCPACRHLLGEELRCRRRGNTVVRRVACHGKGRCWPITAGLVIKERRAASRASASAGHLRRPSGAR